MQSPKEFSISIGIKNQLKLLREAWRTRLQPIRTQTYVQVSIKLKPAWSQPLYQKLANKSTQLYALGMSCQKIADKLNAHRKIIKKALNYRQI